MNIFDTITNPITEYIFDTSALYLQIKNSINETKGRKNWAKTQKKYYDDEISSANTKSVANGGEKNTHTYNTGNETKIDNENTMN